MIPTRLSAPFGRPSPRLSEVDLAQIITRAIDVRVNAKREQGFATTALTCDGSRRTTLLDGGSCQVDGDVCIAQRQDGLTVCVDSPAKGSGLTSATLAFKGCEPVAGWYLLDGAGFLYAVPAALLEDAPYLPASGHFDDPVYAAALALVRAGTWSRLMCGATIEIALNDGGGAEWIRKSAESEWTQSFQYLVEAASGDFAGSGILWRDHLEPNAGVRKVSITLPSGPSGVVSGSVDVAYGHALAFDFGDALMDSVRYGLAPYPARYTGSWPWDPTSDTRGRVLYDMAQVYPLRAAVLYGPGHLNLDGPDIATPDATDDLVSGSLLAPPLDVRGNLLAFPGNELVLFEEGASAAGSRLRVRPAPSDPLGAVVSHGTPLNWGDLVTNPWLRETVFPVVNVDGRSFDLPIGTDPAQLPDGPVPVVVWRTPADWPEIYQRDPGAVVGTYYGVSDRRILVDFGGDPPTHLGWEVGQVGTMTVLGVSLIPWYGWTFELEDGAGGTRWESALSPLANCSSDDSGGSSSFRIGLSVPAGPPGTFQRHVYRFAIDLASSGLILGLIDGSPQWRLPSAWDSRGKGMGHVYDRMTKRVLTIDGNDPADVWDDVTSLSYAGTRPPSPFVHVLPGVNRQDRAALVPPLQLGG